MKKIIVFLLLFVGMFTFSNEYSEKEKNVILTKFIEFQKAVKAKDMNTLNKMIDYPLYGFSLINGVSYEESVTQAVVMKNKGRFLEDLKDIQLLKVDLKNNTIKSYTKGEFTISAGFMEDEDKESYGFEADEKILRVFFSYDDPEFPGYIAYFFNVKNSDLKLTRRTSGP